MVPYHMMICWTGVSKHTRTGQPGLWLIAGGLAQCRIRSKHLALQIKAIEEGLLQR
jgi:putative flavoprotein involved in K+ transport